MRLIINSPVCCWSQGEPDMAEAALRRLAEVTATSAIETKQIEPEQVEPEQVDSPRSIMTQASFSIDAEQALKLNRQGETLKQQENWEGAIAAYLKAVELNPNFSWSHHSLGDCYKKLSQWKDAGSGLSAGDST